MNQTFLRSDCIVFHKTNEPFGGLSNMAGGFALRVNGAVFLTSEALYQACRFPDLPEVQALILKERSPMGAKMRSKPFRTQTRPDWDDIRVDVMRWCLFMKLAQHWDRFGMLLRKTCGRTIVEQSHRDRFWGAVPTKQDPNALVGQNVLGRLLGEVRGFAGLDRITEVTPPPVSNFKVMDYTVGIIDVQAG